ncbi:hypothetical protein ACG873_17875 [Mesorhizobium sp. AaZ16]|uniref:hypothetical protein n=1 Tax=Mesorhizobium sp. AaZ16 TaxID=3402289 RepID=UPI00374E57B3
MATSAARMRFSASRFFSIAAFQSIAAFIPFGKLAGRSMRAVGEGVDKVWENIPDKC